MLQVRSSGQTSEADEQSYDNIKMDVGVGKATTTYNATSRTEAFASGRVVTSIIPALLRVSVLYVCLLRLLDI